VSNSCSLSLYLSLSHSFGVSRTSHFQKIAAPNATAKKKKKKKEEEEEKEELEA